MAKRQDTFDVLIDISAKLPWWVGVILAFATYGLFHWMAGWQTASPKGIQALGDIIVIQFIRTIALFLQYLVPAALLIGAAMSAYGRWKRANLLASAARSGDTKSFHDMSWKEFELLVGEAFRGKGFEVRETGGSGPDGGVDLVLSAGSEKYLVQCKRWRAQKVDVSTVRELYGVMAERGASGGFVVSAGDFTKDAAEFASGRNIELISQHQLMALVQEARPDLAASKLNEAASGPRDNPVADAERANRKMRPSCPNCGNAMVERIAKRGANAGKPFWGCSTYPNCRGTLPIAS